MGEPSAVDLTGLADFFGQVLSECHDRGMPLPWLLAVVAINGSAYVVRMTGAVGSGAGLNVEQLAEHIEGNGFQLPINIMIVDAIGDAARVTIQQDGATWH